MAKQPREKLSGKEARYILKQNNVNLAWLAEQLNIAPQSIQSRLNAAEFKLAYQLEINNLMGKRIFDIDMANTISETKGRIPVIDMRMAAGFGVTLLDGNEHEIKEYVTMDGLSGCVGVYVYGDSMAPEYRAGDVKEKDYPSYLSGVHYNVKAAAKKLGFTRRVSFYTARKSFVQHGFELGIPLETLEYCVGQTMKSNRPIFNYVRIMRQHADLAIRQIIDQLKEKEDAAAPSK